MTNSPVYYIDCDPGIDDALALAYLLRTGVEIASIGVVQGNAKVAVVAENTRRLLALAGRTDIRVSVGTHDPIVGEFWGGAPHVHGVDGLGGVELPPSHIAYDDFAASDRLIELARQYGTRLRIIALGPLTNIAAAIAREQALPQMVDNIVIMGGAYRARGNVTPQAEANIYADPHAAARVFAAPWRTLLLVPLDITHQHLLSADDNRRLSASTDPLVRRISEMMNFYLQAYHDMYGQPRCVLHDPLAAALAIGAITLKDVRECGLSVVTDAGPDLGKTVVSIPGSGPIPNFRNFIALSTEQELLPLLLDTIGC